MALLCLAGVVPPAGRGGSLVIVYLVYLNGPINPLSQLLSRGCCDQKCGLSWTPVRIISRTASRGALV